MLCFIILHMLSNQHLDPFYTEAAKSNGFLLFKDTGGVIALHPKVIEKDDNTGRREKVKG